ncbi:MAG: sigma-70 family RNA polymerase sigma factor [Clostridia bacterium]|nr:sigma-70 family RNA polymerase sigma factor [Clostridia bacterium]
MSNVQGPDSASHRDQEFVRLVERYQAAVLRTCYLYLCDKSLAEDASQETFIKVFRSMDTFRGDCSEKTWIMKIAMRTCYDINHSGWHRFFNRRLTPEMLPEAAVPFDEVDDELTNAVIRLPLKLREVILLRY